MRERTKPSLRSLVQLTVQLTVVALVGSTTSQTLGQRATVIPDCPKHGAVAEAVRALLDSSHVEVKNVESKFELRNAGQRFSVMANGRSRNFDDPEQDCVGRTRTAAVFVALTLAPPDIGLPPTDESQPVPQTRPVPSPKAAGSTAPPPEKPVAAPTQPMGTVSSHWHLGAEMAAVVEVSPNGHDWRRGLGIELRLALTKPGWGWTIGTLLNTVDDLQLRASKIEERRIPVDFGLRWIQRHAWGTTFVEGAAVLAMIRLQQVNSSKGAPARNFLDVGGKAAMGLHIGHSTISPVLRVTAEVFPAPRAISVDPSGKIGTTSWLWMGAAIGLAGYFY